MRSGSDQNAKTLPFIVNNMQELKLHSSGENNHLKILTEKHNHLVQKVKENETLTASQKKAELKKLNMTFKAEKIKLESNLY